MEAIKNSDKRLTVVLDKLHHTGMTLNKDKCKFSTNCVQFLGQQVDSQGIIPDPQKVSAILQMAPSTSVKELRRFLDMTNHLSKFTPHLAEITENLCDFLAKKNHWTWEESQQKAFEKIK